MRAKMQAVLERAIDEGLELGWNHAHKHTSTPNKDAILSQMNTDIWNQICEYVSFDDEVER